MENIKEGARAVGEAVSEQAAHAKHEAHKSQAKNPDNTVGDRVSGAANAAQDKMQEIWHKGQKEIHKQKATH